MYVVRRLQEAGYAAFLVGGCVRDIYLGSLPHDWDVATDARPEAVRRLFPRTHDVGARFGTVGVIPPEAARDEAVGSVEVTTFRKDLGYQDGRRPTQVSFGASIEEDLARRDFTMNAVAWNPAAGAVVDPFHGLSDIEAGLIRAVGDPTVRFREDALRMLRAVRFSSQLGFTIDPDTWTAIEREAHRVQQLSSERIRDELLRLLETDRAGEGLWVLHELGLMRYCLPELQGTFRMAQGKPGAPTLLAHLIQTVDACPPDPVLRLAALFHDVGKLTTRAVTPEGRVIFHGHEKASAEVALRACRRLRMPKRETCRIVELVRMHMVFGEEVGKKAVRRWVAANGEDWVRDLILLRRADHVASGGDPGDNPFADRLERLLDEVVAEGSAFTVRDLAIGGREVMAATGLAPGPKVGEVLQRLLERVLEAPELNEEKRLIELAREIAAELD
jgi:poly(A) polymerase